MTNFDVIESATLTQSLDETTGKRWKALLIKAGWGSKAYYTEEALRADGPTVFKAGTPIFLDHQTPEDRETRPFGSVTNLAGELATDAYWDAEEGGLVAEVEIFEHEQARVRSLAKKVGLSIRATTKADRGTMEGRSGRIVTGLVGARSVDLVVRAGAGGQLLDVLESDIDIEMEEQQMSQEILDAIKALSDNSDARFAELSTKIVAVEESLAALPVAEVEAETEAEAEVVDVDIAQTVAELVAAELDKIKSVQESAETEGNEETDEVEESASDEIKLPKFWAVKGDK
jgi:hypothetical protein